MSSNQDATGTCKKIYTIFIIHHLQNSQYLIYQNKSDYVCICARARTVYMYMCNIYTPIYVYILFNTKVVFFMYYYRYNSPRYLDGKCNWQDYYLQ